MSSSRSNFAPTNFKSTSRVSTFLSISEAFIPNELTPRFHSTEWLMGYVLFFAFIILAFARFARAEVYQTLILANGKFQGIVPYVREVMPLNKPSSWLLIINYVLSMGAISYLLTENSSTIQLPVKEVVFLIPIFFLLWSLIGFVITGWLTGESDKFSAPITFKIIGAQLLGLLYFLCAILWLFMSFESQLFTQIVVILFLGESFFRIVKSVRAVFKQGVSWYYIILYLCTLEILPLLMAYYALNGNIIK
jgi:hypothetical protein